MENEQQNFEASQQPQINPVPPRPKKLSDKMVVIIVLAVVAAVVFYIALNKQSKDEQIGVNQNPVSNQKNNQATETPTQSVDIKDWQTHTDNTVGVSIKFPKNWYVVSPAGLPGFFWLSNVSRDDQFNGSKMNSDEVKNASSFRIKLRAFDNKLPIEQWYNQYFSAKPLSNITEKNAARVAGLSAIEVKTINNYTGVQYRAVNYFVAKGGHIIDIEFNYGDQNYLKTYQTILANLEIFNIPIPGGSYKISKNNIFPQPITTTQMNEDGYRYWHNSILMPAGNSVNGELIFISPQGTQYPVAESTDKQIGNITNIATNPQDNDLVFISGSNYLSVSDISSCINKLYTYNLKTGELIEFYSETSKNNSPMESDSCRILRARGTQGSKLILQTDDPDNSPGLCTSLWSDYKDRFLYSELSDSQGGLKKFTVPEYKISEGEEYQSQCLQELQ